MHDTLALNLREVAQTLNVSPRTIWTLAFQGKLPCVRIGAGRRRLVFRRKQLEEWLAQEASKQAAKAAKQTVPAVDR